MTTVTGHHEARPDGGVDLFVSYAGPDRPWAEWAATQLEAAGHTVELDVWDWRAGDNFVLKMTDALDRADRVLALFSPDYFDRARFSADEWTAVVAQRRRLIPVRVAEVSPPTILGQLVYKDVFGVDEPRARAVLLAAVGGTSARGGPAPFPGGPAVPESRPDGGPRVPGTKPAVWNVRARNSAFVGRQPVLAAIRDGLTGDDRTMVHALHGIGGVGKTSLAVEYAHLFAGDYDVAWWVDAERAELVGEQLARLADAAGWTDPASPVTVDAAWAVVQDRLRRTGRWLIVFDNVETATGLQPWLPQGAGHVLVTSRSHGFSGVATRVDIEAFSRAESLDLLDKHVPDLPDADVLAAALGDLPLAVAQAAGLLAETHMTAPEYLDELNRHAAEILAERPPSDYPTSLAAAIESSLTRLLDVDPAAAELLRLTAVLAPEPIPLDWFRTAPAEALPAALSVVVGRPLLFRKALSRLADLGLVTTTAETLTVHRLTQAVLRARRTAEERADDAELGARLVAAAEPDDDGTDPASWPAWAALMPHMLALDPTDGPTALRPLACNGLWYLLMRGDHPAALSLATAWHSSWLADSGGDDDDVLWIANQLGSALEAEGRSDEAHELFRDALTRHRRTLGESHPASLALANNLATSLTALGHHQEAHDLYQDTHARYRSALGEDHPNTLSSANNLAASLSDLGRHQEAHDLYQETHARRRAALGEDHPDALQSANNLAASLSDLGHYQEAHDLLQHIVIRFRHILGDDHPHTQMSAHNLAVSLRGLGRHAEADDLLRECGLNPP
jgi:tetratricopeptide (TPR) repeat protein